MTANIALEEVLLVVLRRYQWLDDDHCRDQEHGPSGKRQIFIIIIMDSIFDHDYRTNTEVQFIVAKYIFLGGYKLKRTKIYQCWVRTKTPGRH